MGGITVGRLRLDVISPRGDMFSKSIGVIALPNAVKSFSVLPKRTPVISSLGTKALDCAALSKRRRALSVRNNFIRLDSKAISTYIS